VQLSGGLNLPSRLLFQSPEGIVVWNTRWRRGKLLTGRSMRSDMAGMDVVQHGTNRSGLVGLEREWRGTMARASMWEGGAIVVLWLRVARLRLTRGARASMWEGVAIVVLWLRVARLRLTRGAGDLRGGRCNILGDRVMNWTGGWRWLGLVAGLGSGGWTWTWRWLDLLGWLGFSSFVDWVDKLSGLRKGGRGVGPDGYGGGVGVSLEQLQPAQELPVPLGDSLAAVHLDEVGVVAQGLQDPTCLGPSLGCIACLVLNGDRVTLNEREQLLGAPVEVLGCLDMALGQG
jgi:hypothetical protein